jgi:hypothetical protein
MSTPTYRNVSSSSDQDLSAEGPHFFRDLTFGEFLAKSALYSKTLVVKRDAVGGETRNNAIINGLLQPSHAACNNIMPGYRASGGICVSSVTPSDEPRLLCLPWPVSPNPMIPVSIVCPPNTECETIGAYNFNSYFVQFPICLPIIDINQPQSPEQPGDDPDVYEGQYSPIPYGNDDGTYNFYVQASDGEHLAFLNNAAPSTNYFGNSYTCLDCSSGTISMFHQSSSTLAYTYYSPFS